MNITYEEGQFRFAIGEAIELFAERYCALLTLWRLTFEYLYATERGIWWLFRHNIQLQLGEKPLIGCGIFDIEYGARSKTRYTWGMNILGRDFVLYRRGL